MGVAGSRKTPRSRSKLSKDQRLRAATFEALLGSIQTAVFVTDPFGHPRQMNAAAATLHRQEPPQVLRELARAIAGKSDRFVARRFDTPTQPPHFLIVPATPRASARPAASLTPREREVVGHLARGESNQEIAEALGISRRTAELHVSRILDKLGVQSRLAVVARVWKTGAT